MSGLIDLFRRCEALIHAAALNECAAHWAATSGEATADDVRDIIEAAEMIQRRVVDLRAELRGVMLLAERTATAKMN